MVAVDRCPLPALARGRHWLAGRIPGAEARITADDVHLTRYERGIAGVHESLRAAAGR